MKTNALYTPLLSGASDPRPGPAPGETTLIAEPVIRSPDQVAIGEGSPPAQSTGIPWKVLAVTATGAFMVSLDLSIVNVAFPSLRESFKGTSTATLSWVLSAYSVVFGALLLGAGRLADRSGRRRWFLRGLLVFTIGSACCAVAPSAGMLIAGRLVQAIGAALLMPAALGLLLAACQAAARTQAVSLFGGISALAVAAGPSLGALVIQAGGWRTAFLVNLPIAFVVWVAARHFVEESSIGGPRPDVVAIGLVCVAVAALALGVSQGAAWGWASGRILGAFVLAATLGPIAIIRSNRHPAPAIDLRMMRDRATAAANAATFLYAVGFFALFLSSVLFLNGVWGYSTLRAGMAITPAPLIVTALSALTGRLATRFGFRPVLVAGGLTIAAGECWYAVFAGRTPSYVADWLPGSILLGCGVALSLPVLGAASVAGLAHDRYSVGGALNQTARQMGGVIGVAVLVAIVGTPHDIDHAEHRLHLVWVVCAAAAAGSSAVSLLQPRRHPRRH